MLKTKLPASETTTQIGIAVVLRAKKGSSLFFFHQAGKTNALADHDF